MRALNRIFKGRGRDAQITLPAKIRKIFSKYGANAHLYMFGPGVPILGPELVTNGDFSGSDGWALDAGWAVTGGKLVAAATSAYSAARMNVGLSAGKPYLISYDVVITSGNIRTQLFGTAGQTTATVSASGRYSEVIIPLEGKSSIQPQAASLGFTGTVDNLSAREILGYSNTYSGFAAGNYFESTGVTHSSVDGSVGLVLDAAVSIGTDLLNGTGNFASPADWSADAGWVISGGLAVASATGGSKNLHRESGIGVGKTYRITADVVVSAGSVQFFPGGYDVAGSAVTSTGKFSAICKAANAASTSRIYVQGSATFVGTVDNLVVREVPGTHAAQSTPGYKPTLRKGIVNLGMYSRPNSNQWSAGVSGTGVAPVVTHNYAAAPDGSNTASRIQLNKGAGNTSADFSQFFSFYTAPITGRYTTALWVRTTDGAPKTVTYRDGNSYGPVTFDGNWKLVVEPRDFTGQTPGMGVRMRGGETADSTADLLVWDAGLFAGTLTAAQIIAAGGIPLTTTAPASSVSGENYLEFDGIDDSLSLPGPLFQQANDHCVIVAVSAALTDGTYRRIFTQENGSSTAAEMEFTNFGVNVTWRDDATNAVSLVGPIPSVGVPFVFSARKTGDTRIGQFNGVTFGSNTSSLGATNLNPTAYFGNRAANDRQMKGKLFPSIVIKGTVSDSELVDLNKFVAQLSGVRL